MIGSPKKVLLVQAAWGAGTWVRIALRVRSLRAGIVFMAAMSVPAMLVEQMHKGACQDQQIRQDAEQVGTMLDEQKIAGDQRESKKHPSSDFAAFATATAIAVIVRVRVHIPPL
jgi:hypothetical protein